MLAILADQMSSLSSGVAFTSFIANSPEHILTVQRKASIPSQNF